MQWLIIYPRTSLYTFVQKGTSVGEILVYARALPALPALHALLALPYCFNNLPFIDGALQI